MRSRIAQLFVSLILIALSIGIIQATKTPLEDAMTWLSTQGQ